MSVIEASAPLRVSFAGGGTDLPVYASRHGGLVLSTTIDRLVRGRLEPRDGPLAILEAPDLGAARIVDLRRELPPPVLGEPLALLLAVLRQVRPCHAFHLTVATGVPTGSGLGASGAVAAVTAALLLALEGRDVRPADVAELAFRAEHDGLGFPVGRQDPYAAAYGGLNVLHLDGASVRVERLAVDPEIVDALSRTLALVRGPRRTRTAGELLSAQEAAVESGSAVTLAAMERSKGIARGMGKALLAGRLDEFATLLDESDVVKRRSNPASADARLDELIGVARGAGALAGKRLGAGGGGHMLLLVPPAERTSVAAALAAEGVALEPVRAHGDGLRVWSTPPRPKCLPRFFE